MNFLQFGLGKNVQPRDSKESFTVDKKLPPELKAAVAKEASKKGLEVVGEGRGKVEMPAKKTNEKAVTATLTKTIRLKPKKTDVRDAIRVYPKQFYQSPRDRLEDSSEERIVYMEPRRSLPKLTGLDIKEILPSFAGGSPKGRTGKDGKYVLALVLGGTSKPKATTTPKTPDLISNLALGKEIPKGYKLVWIPDGDNNANPALTELNSIKGIEEAEIVAVEDSDKLAEILNQTVAAAETTTVSASAASNTNGKEEVATTGEASSTNGKATKAVPVSTGGSPSPRPETTGATSTFVTSKATASSAPSELVDKETLAPSTPPPPKTESSLAPAAFTESHLVLSSKPEEEEEEEEPTEEMTTEESSTIVD